MFPFVSPGIQAPRSIARACRLLLLSMALGVVSLAPSIRGQWWSSPDSSVPDAIALAFSLSFTLAELALYALLVYLTYTRRNWARWALLSFLTLGWVLLFKDFSRLQSDTPIAALWDAASTALEITACYLLFLGRDASWFQRR